jgi:F5/8 type C domain
MLAAVPVLFGGLLAVATALAIGRTLLRRAAVKLYRDEELLLGFILGSAVLSGLIFILCATGLARRGVFLAIAAAAIAFALRSGAHRNSGPCFPPLPRFWKWLFLAGFSTFTVVYLPCAMAPEFSPDGVAYHLAFVNEYLHAHGFVHITTNMYANLSQGIELLYLMAFAFGRHSAASLVHLAFLIVLALSILSYGRRAGYPAAGVGAALLVYASPVVGKDGTCAYIDVAVAAVVFGVFYLVEVWDAEPATALLIFIGLTAGFCYGIKYTAALAIPYAAGFVFWRRRSWRAAAVVLLSALVLSVPWMVKDALWVGNPFSPMFNRWFPNPNVHILLEQVWTHYLSLYSLKSRWQIPWELTVKGARLEGFIGPVFLWLPLALLSLRTRVGRRLCFAGALFASTYFMNIGARFAITPLPFFALALAMVIARYQFVLAALVAAHCLLSFPGMQTLYCDTYAWRLDRIPWKAGLRIESEDTWLSRTEPGYLAAKMIERVVPPGARVLTMDGGPAAYTNRDLLVSFQCGQCEDLTDIFYAGFDPIRQPTVIDEFQFPSVRLSRIRVVETAAGEGDEQWSVTEMRLYANGRELPRARWWRVTAHPNPWDVGMAFDNSPVTRWRSWETMKPGMYLQVDLGEPTTVDKVRMEMSPDERNARLQLRVMDASGEWRTLPVKPARAELPQLGFLGKAAMSELRARHIRYLYLNPADMGAKKIAQDPSAWGLTLAGASGDMKLYRIDAPVPAMAGR